MIAWLIGSRGALPKPCRARNRTSSSRLSADAQSIAVTVKAAMDQRKTSRRPNFTASQPEMVVPRAEATMKAVTTQPIWSGVAERLPCMAGRAT